MLENIRIILVNTFHPGNIGSALRAMKTMGLSELVLVAPQCFPHSDVEKMAAGANDLIKTISIEQCLEDAIKDCSIAIGASARTRGFDWPMLSAQDCAIKLVTESLRSKVALVFGREKTGLTNKELQFCNFHVMISANPAYPVLNLSQAVQVLCYEIWNFYDKGCVENRDKVKHAYPDHSSMEVFYKELERVLYKINFIVKNHPGNTMIKLRRMFNRSQIEDHELDILRGILARIEQKSKENI